MRFAIAHKTSSYLMVLFAYLAMISGAAVPPAVAVLGLAGLAASWWWEPPRVRLERWTIVWNVASILVLIWAASTAVLTGDFLGVGGTFLTWLVIAKAFNRRSSRDWQQLYLLSFLMLIAGSVLNEDFTYGLAFLGFVLASTWALILSHLRREMEDNFLLKHADDKASERVEVRRILDSRRIVGGRFFVGTGAISLAVFALSAAFFLTIPRVGAGFFMKGRQGPSYAGFSDSVKLGSGHGSIKDDDTVVMRVEIQAPYRGRAAPAVHWRGVAFDQYSQGEWRRTRAAPRTQLIIDRDGGRERRLLMHADPDATQAELEAQLDGLTRHHVYLEPMDNDVLFSASMPLAVELQVGRKRYGPRQDQNDEVRFSHTGELKYTAWSRIEPPPPEALRAAPKRLPPGFEVFLQLPREITQRTRDLARRITAGKPTDYDRATAIAAWLGENLSYTLELADAHGQEPIDFFLFDRKRGHCEYFASAFAILARAAGVPVRNVNGFMGGEWNEYYDYIAVRAGDAHSWNEVYFHGVGWVTFDATPASQDQLGRGGGGLGARLGRLIDTLRFQWFKWVVDYDLGSQLAFFKDVGRWFKRVGRWIEARALDAKAWLLARWYATVPLALALAAWLIARALRRRRDRPATERRARPRDRSPMAALYGRVLRRLAKRGLPRDPATTPRELARAAAARALPGAAAFGELTELYYAAEWGAAASDDTLARARALADEIERGLEAVPR